MKKVLISILITIIVTFAITYYSIKIINIQGNTVTIDVLGLKFDYYWEE